MKSHRLEKIFDSLNSQSHRVNEKYSEQLPFNNTKNSYNNNTQYWLFSDLYNTLGRQYVGDHNDIIYTSSLIITQDKFNNLPIKNSQGVLKAQNFNDFFTGHVEYITNDYNIKGFNNITYHKRNGPDAKLSRYASWALLKRWPKMIFTQLYFLMENASFKELYNTAYKFSRIHQRDELRRAEKIVNGIAYYSNGDLRQFNRQMNTVFFGNINADDIKTTYDIKGTIFDYMGSRSLMARQIALNKAIRIYGTQDKIPFNVFLDIIYRELSDARTEMIKATGIPPESDISEKSVARVVGELKKMEREFINKYAFQSLR